MPGTAVLWCGQSFEVVGRMPAGSGVRWTLRSWDEPSAMRNVFTLNRESVQDIADRTENEVRNRRARGWTLVLLPVLGLAPAVLQKKWANEWGFAAGRATMVSATLEMLAGTVGTVQLVAAAVGAVFFMPLALALPGPLLFVFGIARLAMVLVMENQSALRLVYRSCCWHRRMCPKLNANRRPCSPSTTTAVSSLWSLRSCAGIGTATGFCRIEESTSASTGWSRRAAPGFIDSPEIMTAARKNERYS